MKHRVILATAIPFTLSLSACRTANPGAENIKISPTVPNQCKNLGVVSIDWAWWGGATEITNVLKNQTQRLGGDTLYMTSDLVGHAYDCKTASAVEDPDKSKIIIPQ